VSSAGSKKVFGNLHKMLRKWITDERFARHVDQLGFVEIDTCAGIYFWERL